MGIRTAESVAAFIDDPHRSRNAKAVGRCFGLVPCRDQSGDRSRLGHVTREGAPVVRRLLPAQLPQGSTLKRQQSSGASG